MCSQKAIYILIILGILAGFACRVRPWGLEKIGTCENDKADRADEEAVAKEVRPRGYRTTRIYGATGHRGGDCPGRSAAS